jgi:hypothetical protein
MRSLRWPALGVLLVALAALIAVTVVTDSSGPSAGRAIADGKALAASASITPQSHLFGERIHVRIDAVVDRRRLDPDRMALETAWHPYQTVVPPVRTRQDVGRFTRVRWVYELYCVVLECAPQAGGNIRTGLAPTILRYLGRPLQGAPPAPLTISWPPITAVSRLDPVDLDRRPTIRGGGSGAQARATIKVPWRRNSATLVAATYRIQPVAVFWTGMAGALVLLVAAGILLRPFLPSLRRYRAGPSPLERALAAVERTRAGGDLAAERKALELLAAELRDSGEGDLAWTASALAWSKPVPEQELIGALTVDVREAIAASRNGHG